MYWRLFKSPPWPWRARAYEDGALGHKYSPLRHAGLDPASWLFGLTRQCGTKNRRADEGIDPNCGGCSDPPYEKIVCLHTEKNRRVDHRIDRNRGGCSGPPIMAHLSRVSRNLLLLSVQGCSSPLSCVISTVGRNLATYPHYRKPDFSLRSK